MKVEYYFSIASPFSYLAVERFLSLIKKYKLSSKKVAIEHNGKIISKENLKKKLLKNNDKVEIVHFIGGG